MAIKQIALFALFAVLMGCGGSPTEDSIQATGGSSGSANNFEAGADALTNDSSGSDVQADVAPPPYANSIKFATCETDPQEVAVPNGMQSQGSCERIKATALYVDGPASVEIPSSYAWAVDDTGVAFFAPPLDTDDGQTRRLLSLTDTFAAQTDVEPWATVSVCALPLNVSDQIDPICGALTVRAVVNLNGKWCFQGATFGDACVQLPVSQDGRTITLDVSGKGSIQTRHVQIQYLGLDYQANLTDPDHMVGTVTKTNPEEELGDWSATRTE